MTVYSIQASFVRGEISEKLRGRVDIEQYGQAAADLTNWLVMPQGGLERRPGTRFIAPLRTESVAGRLCEFEFNEEQAYCLIFNDSFIWIATLGAMVGQTAQNITALSRSNPGVVTYSGADTYANNDRVMIKSVVGMTEVNNRIFTVANVNTGANTFELSGVDTSSYTAYGSGGTVQEIVAVGATDYPAGVLFDLQFAQAGDTLYIADDGTPPAKLVRSSETSWALSTIAFEDGPWLEEDTQGTTMTPAQTGSVVAVDMTSNSTSSYTAADTGATADAFQVFDRDLSTNAVVAATAGFISIDFPSTDTKVADAYWLVASSASPELMPTHWVIEGQTAAGAWEVVDARAGETAWAPGERRYYEMANVTAYRGCRITWYAVDGGSSTSIAEWVIHESGASQTAFNLTASAVTGINGGTGFQTTDVGRTIRLMGSDGIWRWAVIAARTSTTIVTIRLYFHSFLDLTPINRWQLSAFSASDGYPATVGFYQDRLSWARTLTQPRTVWSSESANYESHRLSTPPAESDAIAAEMTGNQLSAITWIEEMADLQIGVGATAAKIQPLVVQSTVRSIGPAAQAEPFSSFNISQKNNQPIALLYLDRYRKRLIALRYSANGALAPDDVSWWSDHLLAAGIVDLAFQEDRNNVAWLVDDDGDLVACTYLPEFGVVAFTPMGIAGTGVEVESVAAIPSAGGAVIYLIVKRTINGATRRYLEYMAPRFETGDTLADAVYFDCAVTYSGSSTTTVTGVTWLIGETVGILVDGVDVGDAVVSAAGTVTSPTAGTKITVGLRYTSRLETLRAPTTGNRDGSSMGRPMVVKSVALDLLNAKGLRAGTLHTTDPFPHGGREAAAGSLNTGVFPVVAVSDKHDNDGVMVVTTDRAYPSTIRALIASLDGAP